MKDVIELALIACIPPTVVSVGGVIVGYYNRRTIKEVKETGEQTHKLVDGTLAIQYQVNATSARALAVATGLPEHAVLADASELKLKEHLATLADLGLREKENE